MGYIPQFIDGDATAIGRSLVTETLSQSTARALIGLGEGDRPRFDGLELGSSNNVNLIVTGLMRMHVTNADGLRISGYYGNNIWRQPLVQFFRYRGTKDEPLDPKPGDSLGSLSWAGRASVNATAMGVDGEPLGNRISIATTQSGTDNIAERVRIDHDGRVVIGAPFTNDGIHQLQVNGPIRATAISGPSGTLAIRNGTNAQSLLLTKTYTSDTNFERLQFDTTDDAYRIGSAVGSAGGIERDITIGRWISDGTWPTSEEGIPYGLTVGNRYIRFVGNSPGNTGMIVENDQSGGSSKASLQFTNHVGGGGVRSWQLSAESGNTFRLKFIPSTSTGLSEPDSAPALTLWASYGNVSNSRVGVGTQDPATRLHVVGNVTLEGLPTTDPLTANRLWNNGGLLAMANFDGEVARTALGLGEGDSPDFDSLNIGENQSIRWHGGTRGYIRGWSGRVQIGVGSSPALQVGIGVYTKVFGELRLGPGSGGDSSNLVLVQDASDSLAIRRDTNAQKLNLYKTYTSDTNFERLQFDTTDAVYRIGSAVGSAGGANRGIAFGTWGADGSFTERMSVGQNSVNITAVTSTGTSGVFKWSRTTSNYDNGHYAEIGHFLGSQGVRMAVLRNNLPVAQIKVVGVLDNSSSGHYVGVYGANEVETARFTADNRLGIGVTTPAKRVEVSTQQDADGLLIRRDSEDDHSYASLFFGAATTPQAKAGILFQRTPGHKGRGTLHFCMYDGSGNDIFVTPADARLSITRQGNVGIGITEPSARLHVVGTVAMTGLPTSDPAVADGLWNNGNVLTLSGTTSPTFNTVTISSSGDATNPSLRIGAGNDGIYRPQGGQLRFTVGGVNNFIMRNDYVSLLGVPLRIANPSNGDPVYLHRGGLDILEQRNDTAGQVFRLHKTYTSNSNREYLQFDATGDAYRIGSAVGSAGGTNRNLELGRWEAGGTFTKWMSVGPSDIRFNHGTDEIASLVRFSGSRKVFSLNTLKAIEVLSPGIMEVGNITTPLYLLSNAGLFIPSLPTTDPATAGRIWNNSGLLSIGEFDIEAAQDALDVGFLNVTEMDTTNDYVYYGGVRSGGSWKINRYDAVTLELTSATIASNAGYANLADAWAARSSLVYV